MKDELLIHNLFKDSIERFLREDPSLRRAANQPFKYISPLIHSLNFKQSGIFMLTGGRQVGKTTLIKQWIAKLLTDGSITPNRITFMTGELIRDDEHLRRDITAELTDQKGLNIIIIDEVNYVKDWDKAVKFLADAGALDQSVLLLSGSDSAILREAMKRFAGRRGKAGQVDFVFHPLSFAETVLLKEPALKHVVEACKECGSEIDTPEYSQNLPRLESLFDEYLHHGGYLTAISDWVQLGKIEPATFRTYADWLRGDILKHNKQEKYLYEVLRGILRTYASQVSWISLSKDLSIEHHKTISDYISILEDMHAVRVMEALAEHKLDAAPKKAKKLYFQDPFIYHTAEYMLENRRHDASPALAETAAVMHYARLHKKTFYIKGDKGEVDIAYVEGKRIFPVEVKWSRNFRPEELKQIICYANGLLLGRVHETKTIMGITCVPLVRHLLAM